MAARGHGLQNVTMMDVHFLCVAALAHTGDGFALACPSEHLSLIHI
ncbi:MAG: hypothetical protein OXB95_06560 [Rhodobacteraceae bacterium]|nr:hypothetical protein [Paracoccaceae bacterium]